MKEDLKKLQNLIKYQFVNKNLLLQAITHKSYDSDNNYEKLEFLGDRVLGLSISEKLIELYPNDKVGILDKKLASLVNKNKCYEIGMNLKLQKFIFVGNNKKKNTIEDKIISDCCEAIIGAIYLDSDFLTANKCVLNIWKKLLKLSSTTIVDSKTQLQEYSLKQFKSLPTYKIISSTGPRHKPEFKVGVKIKSTDFIYAKGSSIKNAEQSAATKLLKKLNELAR